MDNTGNCDNILQVTVKRVQQEAAIEKDRVVRQSTEKCTKEKSQLSQQLSQQNALDLSYLKQDILKQYRIEKDIVEKKCQLKCSKDQEDLRKDLLFKYRQEQEQIKKEYAYKYLNELSKIKDQLLVDKTSENDENSAIEKPESLSYWNQVNDILKIQDVNETLSKQCSMEKDEIVRNYSSVLSSVNSTTPAVVENNPYNLAIQIGPDNPISSLLCTLLVSGPLIFV
jgi:hypothetical protein